MTHQSLTSGISCGTLVVEAAQANGAMASVNLPLEAVRALNSHRLAGGGPALFSLRPISISDSGDDQNISFDPEASFLQVDLSRPNPQPVVRLSVSPASVVEDGTQNLVFTFTRSGVTTAPLNVSYTVSGTARATASGADPADYTGLPPANGPRQITIPAGAASASLTLDPQPDSRVEPLESVVLDLAAGNGYQVGSPANATGSISNDDVQTLPQIRVAVSPAVVAEDGTQNLVFTFTRSGATDTPLTVDYTVAGTARAEAAGVDPADFRGLPPGSGPREIRFAAGSPTATLSLDPIADSRVERDESIVIRVAPGSGYSTGTPAVGIGRIRNDDPALPSLQLRVSPERVTEGAGQPLVFTLRRTGPLTNALDVPISVGGTARGPGNSPAAADYAWTAAQPMNPVIRFAPGSATARLQVTPIDDSLSEADETVLLTLQTSTRYRIAGRATASATISDDDPAVSEFRAAQPIALNDNSKATPYPSGLLVDGLTGDILDVNVTLHGLTHPFPDDLDILLVSPAGEKVMLMSDCGGSDGLVGVDLLFDQAATRSLGDLERIISGTYLPSNYGTVGSDLLPAVAPAGPYGTDLSRFNGSNPNGLWRLFVIDDLISDSGTLAGGWSLAITTVS